MPDSGTMLQMYEVMSTIKRCAGLVRKLLMSGQLAVMCHSPRGHEAISAGFGAHLSLEDYTVTTYRGMGDQIAKGVPLRSMFAEYFGKADGACKGKGGPMHLTHAASGLMVTTGIVGGGLPIANGYALASKMRNSSQVTICNFGDGASNIGAFHESLNLAALWKLPIVFVCHNNGYAEHTAVEDHLLIKSISERAASYGMPGVTVDGSDPEAVYSVAETAIRQARAGEGPTLVEAVTDRLDGHYIGDAEGYVPASAKSKRKSLDSVDRFREKLIDSGIATEVELKALEDAIDGKLQDALDFAKSAPYPEPIEIQRDVFSSKEVVA